VAVIARSVREQMADSGVILLAKYGLDGRPPIGPAAGLSLGGGRVRMVVVPIEEGWS
jgi:hypothetical protein